jgi:hypothetical protein
VTIRRRVATLAAIAGVLLASACGPAPVATDQPVPTSTGTPLASALASAPAGPTVRPTVDRATGWRTDLEQLIPGMAAIHPNLTHSTTRAALDQAVADLVGAIDASTDDELMVGVLRIVAMVSAAGCDAHTGAYIWGSGTYPVDSLPLRLWLFPGEHADQLVIVDALAPYQALIGSRIDAIEGRDTLAVRAAVNPIIPRDNDQTRRLLAPRYLLIPQVLRGLGLADAGPVSLRVTDSSGQTSSIDVEPVSMARYNDWAGPYGLHLPADPDVLYLSRIDDVLWWQMLPDARTLYVQYNRADSLPAATLDGLRAALDDPGVERVVLDVRHNFGGELHALDPIVDLFSDPRINQPDRLFVITGRNTFSGGSILVARLIETNAVTVGEPSGGCPTIWSDPSDVRLPYSGIVVSVAGDTAVAVDPNDPRQVLEPDSFVELGLRAWLDGRDPALESIVLALP